jgi:hypothetical protein
MKKKLLAALVVALLTHGESKAMNTGMTGHVEAYLKQNDVARNTIRRIARESMEADPLYLANPVHQENALRALDHELAAYNPVGAIDNYLRNAAPGVGDPWAEANGLLQEYEYGYNITPVTDLRVMRQGAMGIICYGNMDGASYSTPNNALDALGELHNILSRRNLGAAPAVTFSDFIRNETAGMVANALLGLGAPIPNPIPNPINPLHTTYPHKDAEITAFLNKVESEIIDPVKQGLAAHNPYGIAILPHGLFNHDILYYVVSKAEKFHEKDVWLSVMNRLREAIVAVNLQMPTMKMPTIQKEIDEVEAGKVGGRQGLKEAFMRTEISRGTDYLDAIYPELVGVANRKQDVEEGYLNPFHLTKDFGKVTGPDSVAKLFGDDQTARQALATTVITGFEKVCEDLSLAFFGDKDAYVEAFKSNPKFSEGNVKASLETPSKEEGDELLNPAGTTFQKNTLGGTYKDHLVPYMVQNFLSIDPLGVGITDSASQVVTGQDIVARNLWASHLTFEQMAKNGYKIAKDLQGTLEHLKLSPAILGKLGVDQNDINDPAWSAGVPPKFAGITMNKLIEHMSSKEQVEFDIASYLTETLMKAVKDRAATPDQINVYNKLLKADPVAVATQMGALSTEFKNLVATKIAGLNADELTAFRNKDIPVGGLTQKVSDLEAATDDVSAKIVVASAVAEKLGIFGMNPVDYTKVTAADYVKDFLEANDLSIQGFVVKSHGQDMWDLLTGTGVTNVKRSIETAVDKVLADAKDEAKKLRFNRVEPSIKAIKLFIDGGRGNTLKNILKDFLDGKIDTTQDWAKDYGASAATGPRVNAFKSVVIGLENMKYTMTLDKTDPLKPVIVVTELSSGTETRYDNKFEVAAP